MKTLSCKFLIILLLAGSSVTTRAQSGIVVHDLSTGKVNGSSTLIAFGVADDTWTVSSPERPGGFQTAYVCNNLNGAWDFTDCGRWVTPYLNGTQPSGAATGGTYHFQTEFNMSTLCFPWAKATFNYVGGDDNIVGFSINGHSYVLSPPSSNDFSILSQNITININPAHIVLGTNTILVDVNNISTFVGFYACGTVSVGYCARSSGFNANEKLDDLIANATVPIRVFPNPSNGQFSVEIQQPEEGTLVVFDQMGRKVIAQPTNNKTNSYNFDLTRLTKGIYCISILGSKTNLTTKFIIR